MPGRPKWLPRNCSDQLNTRPSKSRPGTQRSSDGHTNIMQLSLLRSWRSCARPLLWPPQLRYLRSDAALEAIAKAAEERTPAVVLYNYPSFSGAFSALFAYLFHSSLKIPCLVLPFSSVVPLRSLSLSLARSLALSLIRCRSCIIDIQAMNNEHHVNVAVIYRVIVDSSFHLRIIGVVMRL